MSVGRNGRLFTTETTMKTAEWFPSQTLLPGRPCSFSVTSSLTVAVVGAAATATAVNVLI